MGRRLGVVARALGEQALPQRDLGGGALAAAQAHLDLGAGALDLILELTSKFIYNLLP
jgi:hypothetical protein